MSARAVLRLLLSALPALALAACGGAETANQTGAATPRGGYVAKMQALNEKERNVALFRAVRDAGRACQGVERSVPTDPVQGRPGWVATCDDGSAWLVLLADDGTATVTDARALAGRGRDG